MSTPDVYCTDSYLILVMVSWTSANLENLEGRWTVESLTLKKPPTHLRKHKKGIIE